MRLRVVGQGPHAQLLSELCLRCPQGVTGCCAAPPVVAWTDLGRIVQLGGRDWLLAEVAAGNLYPCGRGLALKRVDNPDHAATGRMKKCVYHGPAGCVVPADRRSATCNYYVCDDVFAAAGEPRRARALHEKLTARYGEWDVSLGERVRARYGDALTWDAAFLDWLGEQTATLLASF